MVRGLLAALALAAALPADASAAPASAPLARVTLTPTADASVGAGGSAARSRGTVLRVGGRARARAYLQFALPGGVTARTRAVLRVYVLRGSAARLDLRLGAPGTWSETSIARRPAPRLGPSVGRSGVLRARRWARIALRRPLPRTARLTLVVSSPATASVTLASREAAAAQRPRLDLAAPTPLALADAARVLEDDEVLVDVTRNDEAPGRPLAVRSITAAPSSGVAAIAGTGVRYRPAPDFFGADAFAYRACTRSPVRCVEGAVTVAVVPVNDAPTAPDHALATGEDTPLAVPAAVLAAGAGAGPANEADQAVVVESVSATADANGRVSFDGTTLSYTPSEEFHGVSRLAYRVRDDGRTDGAEDFKQASASISIAVGEVNDAPRPGGDAAEVTTDPVVLEPLANDLPGPAHEAGEALALTGVEAPSWGTATLVDEGSGPRIRYVPRPGYGGPDWVDYTVCDQRGACAVGTVTLAVKGATRELQARAETTPLPHAGNAGEGVGLWRNAADPDSSTVYVTDKGTSTGDGGIGVYTLNGHELQYVAEGSPTSIDVRDGSGALGAAPVAAAGDKAADLVRFYRLDPVTGRLAGAGAAFPSRFTVNTVCLYVSPVSGEHHAFVTSATGRVQQWRLRWDGAAFTEPEILRTFNAGPAANFCEADDARREVYITTSQGIVRFDAEPGGSLTGLVLDPKGIGDGLYGLALAARPDGTGALLAATERGNRYAVYSREAAPRYLRTVAVVAGEAIDGTSSFDIAASALPLGGAYPEGALILQDKGNPPDNHNAKVVALGPALADDPPTRFPPRPVGCGRPYAAGSPWNAAIPAGQPADPDSAARVAALENPQGLSSDPAQFTYPVYVARADSPVEVVNVFGNLSDVRDDATMVRSSRTTVTLRIPAGARAALGSDAQMIVVDPVTGEEWGFWRMFRDAQGQWGAQNAYRYNTAFSGVPPADATGQPFGSRGAGVPYLAGLVRPCELDRGEIDHALAFAYPNPTTAFVWPATKSDGRSTNPLDLPEGARLQLDPALSRGDIEALGCTGPCLTIARALQRYGMYVIDVAGRPKVMLEYDGTANWSSIDARTVAPLPLSRLRVLPFP